MHVHKPYPFHPTYWATECWFWPGFLPWKIKAQLAAGQPDDWSGMNTPYSGISEPGTHVSDATQMIYRFGPPIGIGADEMLISLEQIFKDGIDRCRWKAVLRFTGVIVASAWLYQDKPQRVVSTGVQNFNLADQVSPTFETLALRVQVATFADGGSPYPDY